MTDPRTVLVTGAAGFVGAAVTEPLLRRGDHVVGLDNLNAYYDPALKRARLEPLAVHAGPGSGGRFPLPAAGS